VVTNVFLMPKILFMAAGSFLVDQRRFINGSCLGDTAAQFCCLASPCCSSISMPLYFGVRKTLLKEMDRTLTHVEKQLRIGQGVSEELTERLKEHPL
jgi:hypothetical protein